ncbi:hypothetical protein [Metaplanococcus flavidus]|uniref:Uncharacterized protein n=1 Tax=Metaplanococcus flavidus TaxID=569883 RepID=A0ABW3LFZ1_9BACL
MPSLSELSKDMEQNSEDAQGIKRSAEIHSGEEPELAQREPPGKRAVLRNIGFSKLLVQLFIKSNYFYDYKKPPPSFNKEDGGF